MFNCSLQKKQSEVAKQDSVASSSEPFKRCNCFNVSHFVYNPVYGKPLFWMLFAIFYMLFIKAWSDIRWMALTIKVHALKVMVSLLVTSKIILNHRWTNHSVLGKVKLDCLLEAQVMKIMLKWADNVKTPMLGKFEGRSYEISKTLTKAESNQENSAENRAFSRYIYNWLTFPWHPTTLRDFLKQF